MINIDARPLDEDQAFAKLLMIQKKLHNSSNPASLISLYDQDPTFHELFNKNGNALENIDKYTELSNEGMMQDYLVYGLYGILGTMAYSKLDRIRSICKKYANSRVPDIGNNYSIYLPSYTEYRRLVGCLNTIYDGFMKFVRDPNAKIENVIESFRRAGISVKYDGDIESLVGIDWKAVTGSILARLAYNGSIIAAGAAVGGVAGAGIGAAVAGAYNVFGSGVAMGHAGALTASDKGGRIGDRGWDQIKIGKAAAEMVQLVDKIDRLKVKPAFKDNDPDIAKKLKFVQQAYKAYVKVIQDIGRGVASACTAGMYNKDESDF